MCGHLLFASLAWRTGVLTFGRQNALSIALSLLLLTRPVPHLPLPALTRVGELGCLTVVWSCMFGAVNLIV